MVKATRNSSSLSELEALYGAPVLRDERCPQCDEPVCGRMYLSEYPGDPNGVCPACLPSVAEYAERHGIIVWSDEHGWLDQDDSRAES